ncbi:MAG: chemotaxis protein, partial [Bacteroidota bacterium]|nr:chemotaxis protein [Bacteroidota bacterium]
MKKAAESPRGNFKTTLSDNFVIGIGASAGGLEAIHALFDNVPEDTGFSFIVIQHLSPDHKSLIAELLSKHTLMQVYEVKEGLSLRPNCIYVIPPQKLLTLKHGRLILHDKPKSKVPNNAIDIFFESLALEKKDKAVGIILSGTGTDGAKGLMAIKAAGGTTVVQDPLTAAFDGMPYAGVAAGADMILPPEMIAEELVDYLAHAPITKAYNVLDEEDEIVLRSILDSVHHETEYDFSHYKRPTLFRRLAKRMSELGIGRMEDYRRYLESNQAEIKILAKEFLINVTRFFRDLDAFETLRINVVPQILKDKRPSDSIKVWVSACSTGEEAYSIAMLFYEYLEKTRQLDRNIKIFATDIDSDALDAASRGVYSSESLRDVSEARVKKFFVKEGGLYRVSTALRKFVVFANHDILKNPPFSHVDLITCRNMLIYFDTTLQNKVMQKFHFALNLDGFLMLGPSENIGKIKDVMKEVDRKWKLFRCINKSPVVDSDIFLAPFDKKMALQATAASKAKNAINDIPEIFKNVLLDDERFTGILTTTEFEVKQAIGNYKRYLKFPEDGLNFNLLKLVPPDMAIALGVCMRKALAQ